MDETEGEKAFKDAFNHAVDLAAEGRYDEASLEAWLLPIQHGTQFEHFQRGMRYLLRGEIARDTDKLYTARRQCQIALSQFGIFERRTQASKLPFYSAKLKEAENRVLLVAGWANRWIERYCRKDRLAKEAQETYERVKQEKERFARFGHQPVILDSFSKS